MENKSFVRVYCVTDTYKMCSQCKREFVLNVDEIATIMKNGNDNAVIQTTNEGYFHPLCGGKARTVQTYLKFDALIKMMNIKPVDLGNVELKVSRMTFDTAEKIK